MEASKSSSASAAPWATEQSSAAAGSGASTSSSESGDAFAERPEVFVGAAFAGGVALAGVLRWLGSR